MPVTLCRWDGRAEELQQQGGPIRRTKSRKATRPRSGAEETSGWAVGFILFAGIMILTAGIILAVLSAIANFLFIPYYPFWALTVIALDVFVVWALAAHGREAADETA
jgi:hypothetical protein